MYLRIISFYAAYKLVKMPELPTGVHEQAWGRSDLVVPLEKPALAVFLGLRNVKHLIL